MTFTIQIVGASGSGLLSTGEILAKALKDMGYWLITDREFPSLIMGGHSCYTICLSGTPIGGLHEQADLMIALDKKSLQYYAPRLKDGGTLVHGYERLKGIEAELGAMNDRGITVTHLPAVSLAESQGGSALMANMVMAGMAWKVLGLPYGEMEDEVKRRFASKPKWLPIDLKIVDMAYKSVDRNAAIKLPMPDKNTKKYFVDGSQALALGAVHAGVRLYVGYPMSPSTGVLKHMANMATEMGIAFKQAEDEITAVQVAIGGMHAGTRALTATSGGGFDLMTETVSLSAITETPLVIIIAQRPGPGTGLPTWTSQGDLNLAAYGGHGEYARGVIACSNSEDSFTAIQHGLNAAEMYQMPVMVLTEKVLVDGKETIPPYELNAIPIERGLMEDTTGLTRDDRFKITESGVSPRWIPTRGPFYFANGDEHNPDGTLTEEADAAGAMIAKRVRKMETFRESLPEPEMYGLENADVVLVGWGSTLGPAWDAVQNLNAAGTGTTYAYMHYRWVFPVRTQKVIEEQARGAKILFIEGSATGQLAVFLERAGVVFVDKMLKWDGRPFYTEEVEAWLQQ